MVDLDWDAWRANYDSMTFADLQAFYAQVAELYPHQESANLAIANEAFDVIPVPDKQVIELGGWNGRLARDMMARGDVGRWSNFDLVEVPQACSASGYFMRLLEDYIWNGRVRYADVFVACHTIEHLSGRHLEDLVAWLDRSRIQWVYFEAPLGEEAYDWQGYAGSHVLEFGWRDIDVLMDEHDYYRVSLSTTAAGLYGRG